MAFYIESSTGKQIDASNLANIDPNKFYIESGTGKQVSGASLLTPTPAPTQPQAPAPTPQAAPVAPAASTPAATTTPTGLSTLPTIGSVAPTPASFVAPTNSTSSSLVDFANALDAATNMAKQKRNAASLGMMTPLQSTVAASDFNSILGRLNAASDNTAQNLTNRAMTAATPTYQTQTIGNDIFQIKYGADGSYQGATKIGTTGSQDKFGLQTIGDTTYQVQYDGTGKIVAATPLYTAPAKTVEVNPGNALYDPTSGKVVYQNPTTATQNTNSTGTTGTTGTLATTGWPSAALQPGSTGVEVSKLQKALGIAQTGIYDDATTKAVLALQQKLGVDNSTGPGYYGPRTMAALGVKSGTSTSGSGSSTGVKNTWSSTQKNSLIGAGLPSAQIDPLFQAVNQHGLQYVLDNSDLTEPQKTALKAIYGIKTNSIDALINSL